MTNSSTGSRQWLKFKLRGVVGALQELGLARPVRAPGPAAGLGPAVSRSPSRRAAPCVPSVGLPRTRVSFSVYCLFRRSGPGGLPRKGTWQTRGSKGLCSTVTLVAAVLPADRGSLVPGLRPPTPRAHAATLTPDPGTTPAGSSRRTFPGPPCGAPCPDSLRGRPTPPAAFVPVIM